LVAVLACALAGTLAVLAAAGAAAPLVCAAAAIGVVACAAVALTCAVRSQRRGDLQRSLAWTFTGYAAALCVSALAALPVIDRWQDLPGLARRIHVDTEHQRLALLNPDETTIAVLDHGLNTAFATLTSEPGQAAPVVVAWFAAQGSNARVLVLLPGHASGELTNWLARIRPSPAQDDGVAGSLVASGAATFLKRYELPQGRRYALLGPR
jgi:hypothetical protein